MPDACPARGPGTTVSYQPIRPPRWARLPSDAELYPHPALIRSLPAGHVFTLQGDSSCLCLNGRTLFNPSAPTTRRKSKLYTLTSLVEVEVEVQRCPTCPGHRRRFIGPDLRESGVFNYNNSILVTHELMDEYTSAYTTSETPFVAWVRHITRRYEEDGMVFMGPDLFRNVWFSYAYLQEYVDDMTCSLCGSSPETTIWDGLTLAFNKKHLKDSILPPTIVHPQSTIRSKVKYFSKQQLLPEKALRKAIRDAFQAPSASDFLEAGMEEEAAAASTSGPLQTPTPVSDAALPSVLPSTPTRARSQQLTGLQSTGVLSPPHIPSSSTNPSHDIPSRLATRLFPSPMQSPLLSPSKLLVKQATAIENYLLQLRGTVRDLKGHCPALSEVFDRLLGPDAFLQGKTCPPSWKSFFKQVSSSSSSMYDIWLTHRRLRPRSRSCRWSISRRGPIFASF